MFGGRPGGKGVGEIRPSQYGVASWVMHGAVCDLNDFRYYSVGDSLRTFEPGERHRALC